MKSKILTPQCKKRIKNFVYVIVTIIVVPLCFEFLFGIKNPRMRIDVIEEDIVFNSTPYTFLMIIKSILSPCQRSNIFGIKIGKNAQG